MEVLEEIQELSGKLRQYQHEYYILGTPTVTDAEYDRMFNRLADLESQYPDFKFADSPTMRVGSDLESSLPEVRHSIPVLSLDKAYSLDEILRWMTKLESHPEFTAEEKIDGVSIVLYYESGKLARAVTRGNGLVGNDITANVKTIGSVPLLLPEAVDLVVRGEIYLGNSDFAKVNKDGKYANPRNLTAGILRRKKSSEVAKIPLKIFVYEGFFTPQEDSHVRVIERLKAYGFRVNPRLALFTPGQRESEVLSFSGKEADVEEFIQACTNERGRLDYDIDGLVFKVDSLTRREELGYTGHHPRWAIAYKFEAPEAETVIENIDVQIGRTGRVTPVARVKPTSIAGSVVSNVTLHNKDYINSLEVGIGDLVAISKRGDVIPAVERVLENRSQSVWQFPETCPECTSQLVEDGAHTFCKNPLCPAQVRGRLIFFCAKSQMDIENLGPETLDLFIREGFVEDLPDLYQLDFDRIENLPGFGEKKRQLIEDGLRKSLEQPYEKVLPSLGIPDLGQKVTELIIEDGLSTIDQLIALAAAGDVERLSGIHGIGEKTSESIIQQLSDPAVLQRIERLRKVGLQFQIQESEAEDLPQIFAGQAWCVTGSFDNFKPRDLAKVEIKKRGGKVVSAVSSKTSHLLAGPGAGSKLSKAEELGITILDEAEFLNLLKK
jgi:DNA ligase (NAD+)